MHEGTGIGGGLATAGGAAGGVTDARCQAGWSAQRRTIACPQHGQGRAGAAGFSPGAGHGAQPVAEAMCSRFALAAG